MWPFKRRKRPRGSDTPSLNLSFDGEFLDIPNLDFFGTYSVSKSGRYALGCCERDWAQGEAGTYVLLEYKNIILTGNLERPNDGKVANNGAFIINDWMFSQTLSGTFYAFDRQGNLLLKKRFNANLFNNGISPVGQFAVCQTCNSDNQDSSLLTLFDLHFNKVVMQIRPETGWASEYEFDVENQRIYLIYDDIGRFAYSFKGEFLDAEKWTAKRIERANPFDLRRIAVERLKQLGEHIDQSSANEILTLLQTALEGNLDSYPTEKALVYRYIGEVYERFGRTESAVENFEAALKLDPRVGVKRKINMLKQTLRESK